MGGTRPILGAIVCVGMLAAPTWAQTRTADQPVRPINRPVQPVPQQVPTDTSTSQAMSDGAVISWIENRIAQMCHSVSNIRRSIVMPCPDGSTITVEMDCQSIGSGVWPNCQYDENCHQTNSESCPLPEKEDEDGI